MSDFWLRIVPIILGPVTAVCITLWYQSRKEKREAKLKLFLTLMAHRNLESISQERVDALNTISVVFHDNPKVVALWYEYYEYVCQVPQVNWQMALPVYIRMLSAMAAVLGYQRLEQMDITKFYAPQGMADHANIQAQLQGELLRVLTNTARIETIPKTDSAIVTPLPTNSITPKSKKSLHEEAASTQA